ncbi:DUF4232 domain-containing protein [Streptomyces sp. NPDC094038]|uniref:DUF4232 domain-containing protein n=1 Tax=Streptomyces sp. NPDC094038 TaxID=3366055 RepID=UPI00382AA4A5
MGDGKVSGSDDQRRPAVVLKNETSGACTVQGFPGADPKSSGGGRSLTRSSASPQKVTLAAGSSATFTITSAGTQSGLPARLGADHRGHGDQHDQQDVRQPRMSAPQPGQGLGQPTRRLTPRPGPAPRHRPGGRHQVLPQSYGHRPGMRRAATRGASSTAAMSITTEFPGRPLMTGAVATSSRRPACAMTEGIGLERARTVAELGPGTGVFTDAILARLAPGARLAAVELTPVLAARLSATRRDTRLTVVRGSAAELAAAVGQPVDAVVSGLPWTVMSQSRRGRVLDAVTEVLAPGGRFTTFAYLHAARTPAARHFTAELAFRCDRLERSKTVWANLKPAFEHRATQRP